VDYILFFSPHNQYFTYSLQLPLYFCLSPSVNFHCKNCSMGENCSSVQQSGISQSAELMPDSQKTVHLRDELSDLIEFPTSELLKTDLTARDRVYCISVFICDF